MKPKGSNLTETGLSIVKRRTKMWFFNNFVRDKNIVEGKTIIREWKTGLTDALNGNNSTITNHNEFTITRNKGVHYTLIESHARTCSGIHVVIVVLRRLN